MRTGYLTADLAACCDAPTHTVRRTTDAYASADRRERPALALPGKTSVPHDCQHDTVAQVDAHFDACTGVIGRDIAAWHRCARSQDIDRSKINEWRWRSTL